MARAGSRSTWGACLPLLVAAWACGDGAVPPATRTEPAETLAGTPAPEVADAEPADEILKRMVTLLAATQRFSFHAEIRFDARAPWGGLVELAGAADFAVSRPREVSVDYRDDESARRLWLDGTNVTLLDPVDGFYAVRPQPGDIDATVDALRERLDLKLPLGELISNDPSALLELAKGRGRNVGLHDADGVACHHLAFDLPHVDLQLWIQAEGDPLPHRVVIVYREEPGMPRFEAALMDWKLGTAPSPELFQAALPDGARRIEFLEARGSVR